MAQLLYIGDDNLFTVTLEQSEENPVIVASCYVALVEAGTDHEVGNQPWPLAMVPVPSERDRWQVMFQDTLRVPKGLEIEALVTVDGGELGKKLFRFPMQVIQ
jgi:hypothetical protein